jgi:hypothetical protein
MSVVLVTPEHFGSLQRTFRHIREQTVADRLEVIIVLPSEDDAFDDEGVAGPLLSVQTVPVGPIADVDKAAAAGIARARADIVSLVEDHAYPEPGWAEALIEAHQRGPWAAIGSTIVNANPDSPCSWCNQLMAYGEWTEPVQRGEVTNVSRHNISFKRAVLDSYGDDLVNYLGRAGGLLKDLRRQGYRFYLEPDARIRHANPSRLQSTVTLRFNGGRLSGAKRVKQDNWSLARRAVYIAGSPLIPFVRLWKMAPTLLAPLHRHRLPRLMPALTMALVLDALGQMIGFAMGPGETEERLANFEFDRFRHLTKEDRLLLSE